MTTIQDSETEEKAVAASTDVSVFHIASVYAEALLNAAEAKGEGDAVLEECEELLRAISGNAEVKDFVLSPAIGRHQKAEVLRRVFESRVSPLLYDFLLVVNDHERLDVLPSILLEAKALRDRRANRIHVFVHTAVPLPEDQRGRVVHELRESFRRDPMPQFVVDPDLIGGMLVRFDDWVFDGSVRNRLLTLRNQILSRSSHEIQSGRDRFSTPIGN